MYIFTKLNFHSEIETNLNSLIFLFYIKNSFIPKGDNWSCFVISAMKEGEMDVIWCRLLVNKRLVAAVFEAEAFNYWSWQDFDNEAVFEQNLQV